MKNRNSGEVKMERSVLEMVGGSKHIKPHYNIKNENKVSKDYIGSSFDDFLKEELFKKNFPQYVTEGGECLSPYFDLFSAGVECATYELNKGIIQGLTKENAKLEKDYNEAEELLDKQIEETFKLFKENAKLEAQLENLKTDIDNAREDAYRQDHYKTYDVLNNIYNGYFEM